MEENWFKNDNPLLYRESKNLKELREVVINLDLLEKEYHNVSCPNLQKLCKDFEDECKRICKIYNYDYNDDNLNIIYKYNTYRYLAYKEQKISRVQCIIGKNFGKWVDDVNTKIIEWF